MCKFDGKPFSPACTASPLQAKVAEEVDKLKLCPTDDIVREKRVRPEKR